MSRLSGFSKFVDIDKQNYQEDESDLISEISTNLSLFSLYSKEQKKKIDYGKIGYFSPFERFINRRSQKRIKDYIYLVTSVLTHYS